MGTIPLAAALKARGHAVQEIGLTRGIQFIVRRCDGAVADDARDWRLTRRKASHAPLVE